MEYTYQELEEKGLLLDICNFDSFDIREVDYPLAWIDYYYKDGKQYPIKAAYKKDFKNWGERFEYNPKTGKYIVD